MIFNQSDVNWRATSRLKGRRQARAIIALGERGEGGLVGKVDGGGLLLSSDRGGTSGVASEGTSGSTSSSSTLSSVTTSSTLETSSATSGSAGGLLSLGELTVDLDLRARSTSQHGCPDLVLNETS